MSAFVLSRSKCTLCNENTKIISHIRLVPFAPRQALIRMMAKRVVMLRVCVHVCTCVHCMWFEVVWIHPKIILQLVSLVFYIYRYRQSVSIVLKLKAYGYAKRNIPVQRTDVSNNVYKNVLPLIPSFLN